MKKFKKVIPALCALLVSAVMLGSSTYAWFSMNKKVTATGMNVTATSNTTYFVITNALTDSKFIAPADNKTELTTVTKKAGGIDNKATNVYPVSYASSEVSGKNNVTVSTGNWYTASSNKYGVWNGGDNGININNANVTLGAQDYFITYTFYVGLAANSDEFLGQVKVSAVLDTNAAIKAAVKVTGKATKEATSNTDKLVTTAATAAGEESDQNFYLSAATDSAEANYLTVTVYVYVDGNTNTVYDGQSITGSISIIIEGTTAKA